MRDAARGPAGEGLTFLAAERRVPGEREEGAQAEEQQRQEGAIAEPHLLGCAAGAGGAEAAWPGEPGPGRGGPGGGGGAPAPGRDGAGGPGPGGGAGGRRRGHGPGAALTVPRRRGAGGAGGLDWAAGPGRDGLGEAGRREPRPGLDPGPPRSRQRRAGRPRFKGAASPAAAASTARGRGGVAAPGIPPARPGTVAPCVG